MPNHDGVSGHGGGPSQSIEQRVGRAVAALFAERRCDAGQVERGLGLPGGAVERLLRGEGSLDLALLQRVLLAVGTDPAAFLTGLYTSAEDSSERTAGEEPSLGREEIETLLEELRTTVRGLVRVYDARATAEDERS